MQRFVVLWSAWQKTILAVAVAPWCLAAAAKELRVEIEYAAPPGCGRADQFREALLRRMPRAAVVETGTGDITLTVRLTQVAREVRGHLRLQVLRDQGEMDLREVIGTGCDEVVEALALTAALAVEQREAEHATEAWPSGDEPAAAPVFDTSNSSTKTAAPGPVGPERPLDLEPKSPGARSDSSPVLPASSTALGLHAFVAQVVAPTVSLGLGIDVRHSFSLSAEWVPTLGLSLNYAPSELLQPPSHAVVGWAVLGAEGCPATWRLSERVAVVTCAAGSVGWISVSGAEAAKPESAQRFWWGLGGLLRAGYRLASRTSIDVSGDFEVPVFARQFETTQPRQTVAATPNVAWRAALGMACWF